MHYVFDTPTDSFVFDVSHQSYVHKLLTGREPRFDTIRQPGGLNGFMLRTESEHDSFGAGHAGTALCRSTRNGGGARSGRRQRARRRPRRRCRLHQRHQQKGVEQRRRADQAHDHRAPGQKRSIGKNVGAIAEYLHKTATNPTYISLHDRAAGLVEKFGGKAARHIARKAEEAAKGIVGRGMIFEEFGLGYYGPIDGHNLRGLIETFRVLKQLDRPVILHAITQKGRGFQPALEKQKKFHGLGPYDPETGETKPTGRKTYSEIFAESLTKLATANDKVVAITAAMPNGTALDLFRPHHPKRYFDVGIAEEHAVLFAAGMATKGFRPFCAIYSTFLQRAFDQVVHDVALQELPVVFCMDRGGLSADDGPTHHGLFDISYLRGIPNIVHMDPKDEDELQDMMFTALQHKGPSAIRYPRGVGPGTPVKETPQALEIGKAEVLQDDSKAGADVAIFSLGGMLPEAERLAAMLRMEGQTVALINARFAKPVDNECIARYAKRCSLLVTFEDHVLAGGFWLRGPRKPRRAGN